MLAGGKAEGEEEGSKPEAPPEPRTRAGGREAPQGGFEDLPGEGYEKRDAEQNRGTDRVGDAMRLTAQEAEVGAAGGTPIGGSRELAFANRTDQEQMPPFEDVGKAPTESLFHRRRRKRRRVSSDRNRPSQEGSRGVYSKGCELGREWAEGRPEGDKVDGFRPCIVEQGMVVWRGRS